MKKIAIFASGTGSNFLAINDALNVNSNIAEVELLVSDKPNSLVVKHAQKLNKNVFTFTPKDFSRKIEYENIILSKLEEHEIDLIVLAGYMRIIGKTILSKYNKKIINIHPALLPKYGGKGMYGSYVHEAVVANKEKESGITIHYVNENYDEGAIIFQESVPLTDHDTPDDVAAKIHILEQKNFPKVIEDIILKEQ